MEDYRDLLGDEFCLSPEESKKNYQRAMARLARDRIENKQFFEAMKIPEFSTTEPVRAITEVQDAKIRKWKEKVSCFYLIYPDF